VQYPFFSKPSFTVKYSLIVENSVPSFFCFFPLFAGRSWQQRYLLVTPPFTFRYLVVTYFCRFLWDHLVKSKNADIAAEKFDFAVRLPLLLLIEVDLLIVICKLEQKLRVK